MSGGGSGGGGNDSAEPYYEFLAESGADQYEIWKAEYLPLELQRADLASQEALSRAGLLPTSQTVQQTAMDTYLADADVYNRVGLGASEAAQQYSQDYFGVAREGLDVTRGQNELALQAQGLAGRDIAYQGDVLDSMQQGLDLRNQYQDYQGGVLQGMQDRLGAQNQLQAGQLGLQQGYQGLQQQALQQEQGLQAGRGELAQMEQDYQRGQFGVAGAQQQNALQASGLQSNQIAARQQMLDSAGPDYNYATGRAAADMDQAEDRAMAIQQRQLQQAGVDPSSGRWQQTMARNFSGQRAAGINAARERERNSSFDKTNQATSDYRAGMQYQAGPQSTGFQAGGMTPAQSNFNTGVTNAQYAPPGLSTGQALPGQGSNVPQRPTNASIGSIGNTQPNIPNGLNNVSQGANGLNNIGQFQTQQANQQSAAAGQALGTAGAAIGTAIAPGIGTAVGGFLGSALGGFFDEGGMPAARRQRGLISGPPGVDQVPAQISRPDGSFDMGAVGNNEYVMDAETVEGIVRQFLNERVAGLQKRLV